MTSTPFKITLQLATPFVMGRTRLTLDGLLSAAVFRKTGLQGEQCIPHIPLEQAEGIFKASSLFISDDARLSHIKVGRGMSLKGLNDLSMEHFLPNSAKGDRYLSVDQQRGPYKANITAYSALNATAVCFYGVGDAQAVKLLIDTYITGIGVHASTGFGQILSTEIEQLEAGDESHWITESGLPARPLPIELWENLPNRQTEQAPANVAVRFPYWDSSNLALAVFPSEYTHF